MWTFILALSPITTLLLLALVDALEVGWIIWSGPWVPFVFMIFPTVVYLSRTILKLQARVEQLEAAISDQSDTTEGGE